MTDEVTKVYTADAGSSNFANGALMGANLNRGNNDNMLAAAMMNGGMGAQWNNPMWLIWAMLFGNGGWMGNNRNENGLLTTQIQNLQGVVQDNHNSDLLMQAMAGNTAAVTQLAGTINVSSDQLSARISTVRDAITAANGNIQLAAQQMISNNNLQSAALGEQIAQQGNGIQREILTQGYQGRLQTQAQGYEGQLNNLRQSGLIQSLSQQQNQLVSNGFTQIGFQIERQGCEIKEALLANTQSLKDMLSSHWSQQDQSRIATLESQLALAQQTQTILAQLNSGSSTRTTAAA